MAGHESRRSRDVAERRCAMKDRHQTMNSTSGAGSLRSSPRVHSPFLSLLPTPHSILYTSIFLLASCTSPTPPLPPPPAGPDTTSHEFIWQIDTLGDGNSSVLYDVAIINDTTIWAVGEIYLKDSTGQVDPDAYGLAKWDGTGWSFSRLGALAPQGYVSNLLPRAIFAIAPNEIWFAAGGAHRLKNNVLTPFWINDFPGNPSPIWTSGQLSTRIWASTSSDVYVVGTAGAIAHFDGTVWRRIESGTSLTLSDVFGLEGSAHVEALVYIVAGDLYSSGSSRIVSIRGTTISDTSLSLPNFTLHSLWADPLRGSGNTTKATGHNISMRSF